MATALRARKTADAAPKAPQQQPRTHSDFLRSQLESPPSPVNTAVASELRFAIEDAVAQILEHDLGFSPVMAMPNISLLLGLLACICSIGSVSYSYIVPFNESKPTLWIGIPLYILFSVCLLSFNSFVRQNTFFVGVRKDPNGIDPDTVLYVSGNYTRFSSHYAIEFKIKKPLPPSSKSARTAILDRSYGDWFDLDGFLVPHRLLADVLDMLGPNHLELPFAPSSEPYKSK